MRLVGRVKTQKRAVAEALEGYFNSVRGSSPEKRGVYTPLWAPQARAPELRRDTKSPGHVAQ